MQATNATQLIRDDIKRIKGLLVQTQATKVRAREMNDGVLRELCMLLEIESELEEKVLCPALEKHAEAFDVLRKCEADREEVRSALSADEDELVSAAILHLTTLESELLPLADALLSAQELDSLGGRMHEDRERLMRDPRFADARPEVVQNPNGGEQMRKPRAA